jgi:hypothetical protein
VLESFLKGENNNPEERMKDMTIKLRNCFVFLIEEKITFKGAKDPRFIKLYSDCVCPKCKDFGSPVSPSKGNQAAFLNFCKQFKKYIYILMQFLRGSSEEKVRCLVLKESLHNLY